MESFRTNSYRVATDRPADTAYECDEDEDESSWPPAVNNNAVSSVGGRTGDSLPAVVRNALIMVLVRLLAAPLLLLSLIAAMFWNLMKGLHRDLVVYPWELLCSGSVVGLALQLLFQTWLGVRVDKHINITNHWQW